MAEDGERQSLRRVNRALRVLLAIWVVAYPVLACGPLLTGNPLMAGLGLFAGAVFLVPSLVGTLVLAVLVWLTNPPRTERSPGR